MTGNKDRKHSDDTVIERFKHAYRCCEEDPTIFDRIMELIDRRNTGGTTPGREQEQEHDTPRDK